MTGTKLDLPARRRRLFAATALLLGTAMSGTGLEAGLRLFPPAWLEQRMRELSAGEPREKGSDQSWPVVVEGQAFRQLVPGSSFTVSHNEYRHAVTIDELGGRTTPYPADYADIVPFLGDSFTFGVGVEDVETFVSLIAAERSRSPTSGGSRHRLLNLGMTGTALHNQLDTLELRHEELGSPAFYVFPMFMGNDLTNIRRHYDRATRDGSSRRAGRGRRWLWQANLFVVRHPALSRLYAIQFLRQKLLALINRGAGGFMDPVFLAMRSDLTYLDDSLVFFRRELARLTEVSSRLRFEYVFILIPDVHQIDAARLAGKAESLGLDLEELDAGQIVQAISRALDDFQMPYLDLGPCLSEAAIGELYYTQDTHFTAAGHALAARCIQGSGRLDHWLGPVAQAAPAAPDRSVGSLDDHAL